MDLPSSSGRLPVRARRIFEPASTRGLVVRGPGGDDMTWDFSTDPEDEARLASVRAVVDTEILPLETLNLEHDAFRRMARPLQDEVRRQGLWAGHLETLHGRGGK